MTDSALTDTDTDTGIASPTVTDEEVVGFVRQQLTEMGLPTEDVTPASDLTELGLDSISIAGLLLTAREELVDAGRLPADASLDELPFLTNVGDLTELLRTLA